MPMDTTEFLTAQGWKGKGTALKQGHMTRPIAVVQKKTLSGVGKDRNEAVPFWDNIFAAAALNIKVASQTPTPAGSGAATPTKDASPAPTQQSLARSSMTAFARGKQEMARRILYSKFLRGEVVTTEDIDKIPGPSARPSNGLAAEAGSSVIVPVAKVAIGQSAATTSSSRASSSTPPLDKEKESKEERRKRRAEKAAKKATSSGTTEQRRAKLERKAERMNRKLAKSSSAKEGDSKKTSKKGKARRRDTDVGPVPTDETQGKQKKRARDTQESSLDTQGNVGTAADSEVKVGKKRKRKADGEEK